MALFRLWGISMSEEVPETVGAATRNLFGAIGFIILLVGADMMAEKAGDRFWLGAGLVFAGVPIFFGGVFWKWIRTKIGPAIATRVDLFTTDPREMALVAIVGLVVLRTVSENNWIWAGAVAAALVLFLFNWRYFKRPTMDAPQASNKVGLDTQSHLDVAHLLDFAVSEAAFWVIDCLVDLSESPEITDGFDEGPDTEKAHKSRDYFVGYVRQQLGPGTFRQSDFVNLMHSAQGEAERELEQTPQDQRPTDIDPLVLRKYKISERQFWRAVRFLCSQRRELKEKLGNSRHSLSERINAREKSGRG